MLKSLSAKTLEKRYAELGLSDKNLTLLHTYFRCASNLYGTITVQQVWEIYKEYEGTNIHKKDLIAFSGVAQRDGSLPYSIFELKDVYQNEESVNPKDRLVINNKLLRDGYYRFHDVYALEEHMADKPFYLPDKEFFLSFTEDRFYFTPEGKHFKNFIENLKASGMTTSDDTVPAATLYGLNNEPIKGKKLKDAVFFTPFEEFEIEYAKSEAKKEKLRAEFAIPASEKILNWIELVLMIGHLRHEGLGKEFEYILDELAEEYSVELSEDQFKQFIDLYMALNNKSNLWQLCGWSPDALFSSKQGLPKAVSIGPNMQKMFESGDMDKGSFVIALTKMGFTVVDE